MWDYYEDKLLLTMANQYEFDFFKVTEFFKRRFKNEDLKVLDIRKRYTKLYKNRKKNYKGEENKLNTFFMKHRDDGSVLNF